MSLTAIQRDALTHGEQTQALVEGRSYLPGDYYRSDSHPIVSGPWIPWCCCWGCPTAGGRGDGRGCLIIAAIIALFASIVTLISSADSVKTASECNQRALDASEQERALTDPQNDATNSHEKTIYRCSHIILTHMAAERTATSVSQLLMGSGLALLTVAFLIAYAVEGQIPPVVDTLGLSGGGLTAVGLIGYGIIQIHYRSARLPNIRKAYDEMSKEVANLKRTENPYVNFFSLYTQGTLVVVYTAVVIVQPPAANPAPAASRARPAPIGVNDRQPSDHSHRTPTSPQSAGETDPNGAVRVRTPYVNPPATVPGRDPLDTDVPPSSDA